MTAASNKGFSLIEVLVTIVILVIGLLGLAGLQFRALTSQMESYQRAQALILLQDMANRIDNDRIYAASYVTATSSPLGTGNTTYAGCVSGGTGSPGDDLCELNNALLGAAEADNTGNKVGAMIGARGCIAQVVAAASGVPATYMVSVAWQGINSTASPAVTCGQGQYGPNDALRRVVSLPLSIAFLK
jgi:type IV pilus assembly protein PilV